MVGRTKTSTKSSPEQVAMQEKRKKSPGRPKSPARTKSPGRQKSPPRTKSPGRKSPARSSPARTKPAETTKTRPGTPTRTAVRTRSPGRLKPTSPITTTTILTPLRRSPIRRSPARLAKEPSEEKEKDVLAVRTRKANIIVDTDTDSDNTESVPEVKEKPKATVRGRTRKTDIEIEPEEKVEFKPPDTEEINSSGLIQRFTRASQNREVERVVHLKHFDSITVTKRLGEFSDEDDLLAKKSQAEPQELPQSKSFTEFGGVYGALFLIVVLPLSAIILHLFCNEFQCSFTKLPNLQRYKALDTYLDAKSFLGIFAYLTSLAILSALPFGGPRVSGLPNKHGKFVYTMNGLFSFAILLLAGFGLELYNIPVADYIVDHIFHLLVASIFFGATLATYLYIRSFYVPVSALNSRVAGQHGIYGFFMGREVNPRIFFAVDLKMLLLRALLLGEVLIDFAYLYQSLDVSLDTKDTENTISYTKLLNLPITLLVYVLLHCIYALDAIIFESAWVTSFEIQQEAFGYKTVMSYFIHPFFTASVVKYIVNNRVQLDSWILALASLAFAVGYILYRGSNNQKDAFRKNPYSPALSHLEAIPTTQGKKLIVSGFWGIVRHPNYLGDIVIHLAFIPFVVNTPPVIYLILVILLLVHRAHRDNVRCKQKYGAAWDRYCSKVKYVLLPKVY